MTCWLTSRSTPPVCVIFPDDSGSGSLWRQIAIVGHLYDLTLETRGLSISWVLAGCGDYRLSSYDGHFGRSLTTCAPPDRRLDVYFDRLVEVASTMVNCLTPLLIQGSRSCLFLRSGSAPAESKNPSEFFVSHCSIHSPAQH
jgi:hypothetical protein